mmetsp:Transcript_42980/g.135416  ORF Transcript_42980/g.135416 Transcript_42980/m.135416 type:complete len:338 (-) Transcript_42980:601-1614(-)
MSKKPGVHDHAPQRREEGQQNHRGVACGQLRRGVVRLQGLIALACMSMVVRVPLELEHHVIRHAARRVPRVLRLHLFVLPRLQLAALQPVVLQVIHTLEQEHGHNALHHKQGHGQRAGQARERQGDARRHQEVDRDLVVPPREAVPPQPCSLDEARVHELALHHPRQELIEALAVARGCRVVISRDVLVMPQGVLHIEVAVGGRAQQQPAQHPLEPRGLVAELVPGHDPDDTCDDARADALAAELQQGQAARICQPRGVAQASQDARRHQQGQQFEAKGCVQLLLDLPGLVPDINSHDEVGQGDHHEDEEKDAVAPQATQSHALEDHDGQDNDGAEG